ncbi:MAG: amino acid--tRNA ligase-related protein [Candidatus Parcubacteria bacterium]|nr:MAG: asparagine synthetase A [Candidatus Parcubacteria bacterium]
MKKIISENILKNARNDAIEFVEANGQNSLYPSFYDADSYVNDLVNDKYFAALAIVRHYVKLMSDAYWSDFGAVNIDLFMLTSSASSPMGPGSDSEVINIQFGKYQTNLTDSSQFGFEPLMFHLDKAYCYLPSMRGENPDARHINQFFHCEAEITGTLDKLLPSVENYVQALARIFIALTPVVKLISIDFFKTKQALQNIINAKSFNKKTFDEVYQWLQKNPLFHSANNFGRNITSSGEIALAQEMGGELPIWLCNYDRDITPFYQKPDPQNTNRVINADLLFPPIIEGGFGGEIVGSGQRQDNPEEIIESLKRQKIDSEPYEWYINLRKQPNYKITSGFGLGIERFIAWALGYSDIKNVIHYPRLKNIKTLP